VIAIVNDRGLQVVEVGSPVSDTGAAVDEVAAVVPVPANTSVPGPPGWGTFASAQAAATATPPIETSRPSRPMR
jgi:hypothetical protein